LFRRGGIWYADGRLSRAQLGKHSLGARDHGEALERLRELDHHMAVKHGRAAPKTSFEDISIEAGWKLYEDHCRRPQEQLSNSVDEA
jgi:hypothetical protein